LLTGKIADCGTEKQDWSVSGAEDGLRDTPVEQAIEASPAMGAHRNSIRLDLLCQAYNLGGGIADADPTLHCYTVRRQPAHLLLQVQVEIPLLLHQDLVEVDRLPRAALRLLGRLRANRQEQDFERGVRRQALNVGEDGLT
jgi:hypothetical protein